MRQRRKAFFKGAPLRCAPACGAKEGCMLHGTQHLVRAPRLDAWRSGTCWANIFRPCRVCVRTDLFLNAEWATKGHVAISAVQSGSSLFAAAERKRCFE